MRIIDSDHLTARNLTPSDAEKIRAAMDRGEITDCCMDLCDWDDCIDLHGDLCLDEDAYEQAMEVIQ